MKNSSEPEGKKPKPKLLRYAGLAANVTLWSDGLAHMPKAVSDFAKKEAEIKSAEKAQSGAKERGSTDLEN